jgi:AraC-like DNA-binding protein
MIYQIHKPGIDHYFECITYENFRFLPHLHRHHELVQVLDGSLLVTVNGREQIVSAGDYAFVPSHAIHAYQSPSHSLCKVCVFSEDLIPAFSSEMRKKRVEDFTFRCRPCVAALADEAIFTDESGVNLLLRKGALYALAGEMQSQLTFSDAASTDLALTERIIRYATEHFADNITLGTMALALGYDEHYLSRIFHRIIPMHFSAYINLLRVDAARELLERSNLTLAEIAMESGFGSIRSFNRVFLKVTGKRPRDCR